MTIIYDYYFIIIFARLYQNIYNSTPCELWKNIECNNRKRKFNIILHNSI